MSYLAIAKRVLREIEERKGEENSATNSPQRVNARVRGQDFVRLTYDKRSAGIAEGSSSAVVHCVGPMGRVRNGSADNVRLQGDRILELENGAIGGILINS